MKTTIKRNSFLSKPLFLIAMPGIALVFGLAFAGCDNGLDDIFTDNGWGDVFTPPMPGDVYIAGSVGYENPAAVVWKNGEAIRLTDNSTGSCAYSVYVSGSDVYAAGHDGNAATVWKNDAVIRLASSEYGDYASSVYVSNNDVYVAGTIQYGEHPHGGGWYSAKLWRNGTETNLENGSVDGFARSVFVVE
ncbi:hypothetical protein AGMMS49991_00700 [Spirochaetia bacterium]|nr:hypothetical protein AGMMS49991_00700 [Spirochaetia bacterium]